MDPKDLRPFTKYAHLVTIYRCDHADRIAKRKQVLAETLARRNTWGEPYNSPGYWIDHFMQRREPHLTARQCLEIGLIDEIVGGVDLLNAQSSVVVAATGLLNEHPAA